MSVPADNPIRRPEDDALGRAKIAESFADQVLALDLLGLRFAPQLAGLPDTRLWGGWAAHDSPAGRMLRHRVRLALIREQWDEMLRLAGSLHTGTITASLLVARLHAQHRRTVLAAALQDYGRLVKTEFILRYLTRPPERGTK